MNLTILGIWILRCFIATTKRSQTSKSQSFDSLEHERVVHTAVFLAVWTRHFTNEHGNSFPHKFYFANEHGQSGDFQEFVRSLDKEELKALLTCELSQKCSHSEATLSCFVQVPPSASQCLPVPPMCGVSRSFTAGQEVAAYVLPLGQRGTNPGAAAILFVFTQGLNTSEYTALECSRCIPSL